MAAIFRLHVRPDRRGLRVAAACAILAIAALHGTAQADISVWGTIYHNSKSGPVTQADDRVLLYDLKNGKWIGPSFTGENGSYRFSDVAPGDYSLHIFKDRISIFNEPIHAPQHVAPILLPS